MPQKRASFQDRIFAVTMETDRYLITVECPTMPRGSHQWEESSKVASVGVLYFTRECLEAFVRIERVEMITPCTLHAHLQSLFHHQSKRSCKLISPLTSPGKETTPQNKTKKMTTKNNVGSIPYRSCPILLISATKFINVPQTVITHRVGN